MDSFDIAPTEPLRIDTDQSSQPLARIDSGSNIDPVPPAVAAVRAVKASVAMGGDPVEGYDFAYSKMVSGEEDDLRRKIAAQTDEQKQQAFNEQVGTMLSNSAPAEPPTETLKKLQSYAADAQRPTDPKSVIEDNYAKEYMDALSWDHVKNTDGFMAEAYRDIPTNVAALTEWGKSWKSFQEYARTGMQDAQKNYDNSPYVAVSLSKITSDPLGIISGYIPDLLKEFNPLYSSTKLRGLVPGPSVFSGFLGSNLEQQVSALWRMPDDLRKATYTSIMTKLQRDNPGYALQFAKAVLGMSSSEVVMNNSMELLNLGLTGVEAKRGAQALYKMTPAGHAAQLTMDVKNAIKTMVAAGVEDDGSLAARFEAAGDIPESGVQRGGARVATELKGKSAPEKASLEALPTAFRQVIAGVKANPGRFGESVTQILEDNYNTLENSLVGALQNTLSINRTGVDLAATDVNRAIYNMVKDQYPGLSNSIMDITDIAFDPISKTYHPQLAIGKPNGGGMWEKQAQLIQSMKNRGIPASEYTIVPKGKGFYAQMSKPLREVDDVMRDLYLESPDGTPNPRALSQTIGLNGIINGYKAGGYRTPDDVLSTIHTENRKVGAYTVSNLMKVALDQSAALRDLAAGKVKYDQFGNPLSRTSQNFKSIGNAVVGLIPFKENKRWADFERVLKAMRNELDDSGQKGRFFSSPGEMDDFYQKLLKRQPAREEVEAYFSYIGLMEMDRSMRNISVWRNKTRLGTETHTIYRMDTKEFGKERVNSPSFDGITMNHLPGGDDTVLFIDKEGNETAYKASAIPKQVRNGNVVKRIVGMEDQIKRGEVNVVRVYDPERRPLKDFIKDSTLKDLRVRYVVTPNLETKALSWDQVPRRGGGHFDYDYDLYIKQARIRPERVKDTFTHWYEGDTTLFPISNRAMGKDLVNKLNEVREALAKGDTATAKRLFDGSVADADFDFKTFQSWFEEQKIQGIAQPARLDVKEPFRVVPKDTKIVQMDDELQKRYATTFKDGTKSGSDARQFEVSYTGERDSYDMNTFQNAGTTQNPIYKYMPAEMIDPMPSMSRALRRIVDSSVMDDYKNFAVEAWLREAEKHLKVDSLDEIRSSPFYYFFNAKDKSAFRDGTPPEVVNQLLTQRYMIKQYVGEQSDFYNSVYSSAQKLADMVYTKYGPAAAAKIDPSWMAGAISDPLRFIRSMVFNDKMGFWNITQVPVQLMTFTSIYALGDVTRAPAITHAAFLHAWGNLNKRPQIIEALDELAQKMKLPGMSFYRPGEFKEAFLEMNKTGFGSVGPEYALKDSLLSPQAISSMGSRILDSGQMFFRSGERGVRYGAWYMAMKEFRDEFPTKALTDVDRRTILNRADMLSGNMSRASASAMHTGTMATTSQFLAYTMRQAELFWGPRTTAYEKFKLYMWNAALFGAPTATGVSGLPFADSIRKYAQENGYVVGDNFITDMITNGIPSAIGAIITGKGDPHKGDWFDFGGRYGNPGGFTPFKDILLGDKSFYDILGGASWDVTKQTVGILPPIWNYLMSGVRADNEAFPLTLDEFQGPLEAISTYSNAVQTLAAINTHRWITKSGITVADDVSWYKAMFMGLSGVKDVAMTDTYLKIGSIRDQKELEDAAFNYMKSRWLKSFEVQKDDKDLAHKMRAQGVAALRMAGMQNERVGDAMAAVMRGADKDMVNNIDYQYYIQKAPERKGPIATMFGGKNSRDVRADAFRRKSEIDKGKQ